MTPITHSQDRTGAAAESLKWARIDTECPRCGATCCCYRAGRSIACRFATGGVVRVHTGTPPHSATFAIAPVDDRTPPFPGALAQHTTLIAGGAQ